MENPTIYEQNPVNLPHKFNMRGVWFPAYILTKNVKISKPFQMIPDEFTTGRIGFSLILINSNRIEQDISVFRWLRASGNPVMRLQYCGYIIYYVENSKTVLQCINELS
jgi:hypothetical protein